MVKQGQHGIISGGSLMTDITRRSFGKTLVGSAAALSLGVSVRPVFAQPLPKRGGKISVAFIGSPVKLDPHVAAGSEEWTLLRSVYDNLVFVDEKLAPKPELAERWEASPDSTEWTFYLRKGVKFHHGREMDADDVIYSYQRILNPEIASPARSVFSMIERIDKLDSYTV